MSGKPIERMIVLMAGTLLAGVQGVRA